MSTAFAAWIASRAAASALNPGDYVPVVQSGVMKHADPLLFNIGGADNATIMALPGIVDIGSSITTLQSDFAGLSNQSTILNTHLRQSAVANTTTAQPDLFSAVVTPFVEGDRLIYIGDFIFVNTSGSNLDISLLFKIAGNNNFTGTVTLASTAAGTTYRSTYYMEAVGGADDLHHFHTVRWTVRTSGTGGTSSPSTGFLSDLDYYTDATATSWVQTQTPSIEPRFTMSVANAGCSIQKMGSTLILNKKS